jgi:cellobiose-specific phosphotransferase system component IIC
MNWKEFLKPDWYLVGLLPLVFVIVSYVMAVANYIAQPFNLWGLLSACPVTAVLLGLALLSRKRFAISAVTPWLHAPLSFVLMDPLLNLQPEHFHHIVSVAVLFVILYHWKEIWNTKGFLFGITSVLAFVIITSNLSVGVVNSSPPGLQGGPPPMVLGMVFAILSVMIFFWHKPGFRRTRKTKPASTALP